MLARKVKSVAARLGRDERAFGRCWPLIQGVPGLLVSPHQERWLFTAARRLPEGVKAIRLYESYLTNFAFANGDDV